MFALQKHFYVYAKGMREIFENFVFWRVINLIFLKGSKDEKTLLKFPF